MSISKEKMLGDYIYRRVMVVACGAIVTIAINDELFKECEKLLPIEDNNPELWKALIEAILEKTKMYDQVYPEQREYLKRYVTMTIVSIFANKYEFEKLKNNRERYKDPESLVNDFQDYLFDSVKDFNVISRKDLGKVREDVPELQD
jgi:hypothetical protein